VDEVRPWIGHGTVLEALTDTFGVGRARAVKSAVAAEEAPAGALLRISLPRRQK
jgi:hypothetical protein